jgi:two-component system chemotaxis response regulator CheB
LTNKPTRILVVDDSALYRQTIHNVLRDFDDVSLVGIAKDGAEAVRKIEELDPDLLTLDVQMPGMDGIEVLREINRRRLRPKAIMVSSLTAEGAQVTTDALLEGAFDFILKPTGGDCDDNWRRLRDALQEKINAFRLGVGHRRRRKRGTQASTGAASSGGVVEPAPSPGARCDAVVLGTSTGGPAALKVVLPKLPAGLPAPVLVVQHMPAKYTRSLAARLDEICELKVAEAADGVEARSANVLIAPGGCQMKLERCEDRVTVRITDDPPENGCRPSVDYLLRSTAEVFEGTTLAVIMTGMGKDGMEGCQEIKRRGGNVFAQHEDDCVVYGMPKAVIDRELADRILPLGKIAPAVVRHLKRSRRA